jgi:hypothetical protein
MSVDTRGRRAAKALVEAAERLGPAPDLAVLRRRRRSRAVGRAGLALAAVLVVAALVGQVLPSLERITPEPVPPGAPPTTRAWPGVPGLNRHVRDAVATGDAVESRVAASTDAVWVLNRMEGRPDELVRVDPRSDRVAGRVVVGHNVDRPVVAEDGAVWLARAGRRLDRPELLRVDPRTLRITATFPISATGTPWSVGSMVAAGGAVWVSDSDSRLLRVDQVTGVAREVKANGQALPLQLAVAGGWVWGTRGLQLHRIDPRDGSVSVSFSTTELSDALPANILAGGAGGLWLQGSSSGGELLFPLDLSSGQPRARINFAPRSKDTVPLVAVGERVVAVQGDRRLFLVDPARDSVRVGMNLPRERGGLAVGAGAVWVTDPARGRLLRVEPGF